MKKIACLMLNITMVLVLLMACGNRGATESKVKTSEVEQKTILAAQVDIAAVRMGEIYRPIMATGTITPEREAHISSKVAGRVKEVLVKEGDWIRKGETILKLEQSDLQLAWKGAEAQVSMARASLEEAKLHSENRALEKHRLNRLYEMQAISQQKNDDINAAYLLAKNRILLAQASLKAAETNLSLAEERFQDAEIKAPFTGLIFRRLVNAGEMIAAGLPVMSLMSIHKVKLEVDIPEMQTQHVKKGAPADVTIDALSNRNFKGRIVRINPRVDPANRTFKVEVEIANRDLQIKPGMFARLTIKTKTAKNIIVVPVQAVLGEDKGASYVIAIEDNKAYKRPVRPGLSDDLLVEIQAGLTIGEKIVLAGNYGLEEGTLLAPRLVVY